LPYKNAREFFVLKGGKGEQKEGVINCLERLIWRERSARSCDVQLFDALTFAFGGE